MNIIEPGYVILTEISEGGIKELQAIEKAGRSCYKSEDKITADGKSAKKFVADLILRQHEAMLEHSGLSVKFIVDRGITHELVRHRLFSFAQESTRYCNYSKNKFGSSVTFIKPFFFEPGSDQYQTWYSAMMYAERAYFDLLTMGASPQEARSVLPHSVKSEIVVTGSYREWRHFFLLRAARSTGPAHPQMEQVTIPLLQELKQKIPVIFDDIEVNIDEV